MPVNKIVISPEPITLLLQDFEGGVQTSVDLVIYPFKNFKGDLFLKKMLAVLEDLDLMSLLGIRKEDSPDTPTEDSSTKDTDAPTVEQKPKKPSDTERILDLVNKAPERLYPIAGLILLSNKEITQATIAGDDALDKVVAAKAEYVRQELGKAALGAILVAGVKATQIDDFFGHLGINLGPLMASLRTPTPETPTEETTTE